jgi:hypothetical protein
MVRSIAMAALAALLTATDGPPRLEAPQVATIDVRSFRSVEGPSSGPAVYYQVIEELEGPFIRASYRPGLESVTMGIEVPESLREKAKRLRWRWRAQAFPAGGNECGGPGDSAASVYATFKRGLKWYILKYAWSSVGHRGSVCDPKRNLFLARDTVILESGGETGVWVDEEIDVRSEFRRHFAGGRPDADVPDLVGVGIMSDGDQTNSESSADYTRFEIVY